jgi:hypothetical protein
MPGKQRHAPRLQVALAPHANPHAPQLSPSDSVSTQTPLQLVNPAGQAHCPPTQAMPPEHALPHRPQFA